MTFLYPTPEIGAAMVQVGIDEWYPTECYLWYTIMEDGPDWEFDPAGEGHIGEPRDWIDDIDIAMDLRGNYSQVLDMALHEGLSPEQLFLVHITRPHWYRSSWEYVEYDMDYDLQIIRREPHEIGPRGFERAVVEVFEWRKAMERLKEDRVRARWAMTERMYLKWEPYWPHWDSWGYPRGLRAALVTTLFCPDEPEKHVTQWLATGCSDEGSREEALSKLAEKVRERRPDLTVERLQELRRG